MNQRKSGLAQAHATDHMRNQRAGQPHRPGVVAQPQIKTPAQKQTAAPSVFRPQHGQTAVQPKTATTAHAPARPQAPPVYRPQTKPVVAQGKMAGSSQLKNQPVAPTVYKSQPVPKVLQTKMAGNQPPQAGQLPRQPVAPPVYRPQAKLAGVQAKMADSLKQKTHPVAPQVHKNQPVPKVLQSKETASRKAGQRQRAHQPLAAPVQGVGRQAISRQTPVQPKMTNPRRGVSINRGRAAGDRNASAVVQRYPTLDDSGRKDALIYAISTNDLTDIIYVGQTTDARAGDRFIEHVKNDKWAPWYFNYGNYYLDDESKWPYRVRSLEALKNVTKFETTAAEQWWLEKYLKEGKKLLNDSTPCLIDNFQKRSVDPNLYDPKNIGVAATWKPSMKAK